jgi:glyoxylase-like metal-dependent hydrolase (beta-lactamase superfamily II)/ferredoxin
MARQAERHAENADGDWFVDRRCIGCGTSTSVAPGLVVPATDGKFVLGRQPADPTEVRLVQIAAELCPTRSIGTRSRSRWSPHHPLALAPGVWRCGGNAWASAGGNSYLLQRPGGNLLVDAPRWSARLAAQLTAVGGVGTIVLTHSDDVADADRYAEHFAAEVWIHEGDRDAAPFATRVGTGQEPVAVAPGTLVIPTPGHTRGHVVVLVDDDILFSGDTLVWDHDRGDLWAEQAVCWFSWPQQLASLERLLAYRFEQVIPSHGAISPRVPIEQMHRRLTDLLAHLRSPADPNSADVPTPIPGRRRGTRDELPPTPG